MGHCPDLLHSEPNYDGQMRLTMLHNECDNNASHKDETISTTPSSDDIGTRVFQQTPPSGSFGTKVAFRPSPTVPRRKGASTVGIGLSGLNQQFCSTMIGITFGSNVQVLVNLMILQCGLVVVGRKIFPTRDARFYSFWKYF